MFIYFFLISFPAVLTSVIPRVQLIRNLWCSCQNLSTWCICHCQPQWKAIVTFRLNNCCGPAPPPSPWCTYFDRVPLKGIPWSCLLPLNYPPTPRPASHHPEQHVYHGRRQADLALGVLSTLTSPSQSCQGPGSCPVPSVWCTPVCHVGFYSWAASSEVQVPPPGLSPYKKKRNRGRCHILHKDCRPGLSFSPSRVDAP